MPIFWFNLALMLVTQAEDCGAHQVAKVIRAVIASDDYREKLMRKGLPNHLSHANDYYLP